MKDVHSTLEHSYKPQRWGAQNAWIANCLSTRHSSYAIFCLLIHHCVSSHSICKIARWFYPLYISLVLAGEVTCFTASSRLGDAIVLLSGATPSHLMNTSASAIYLPSCKMSEQFSSSLSRPALTTEWVVEDSSRSYCEGCSNFGRSLVNVRAQSTGALIRLSPVQMPNAFAQSHQLIICHLKWLPWLFTASCGELHCVSYSLPEFSPILTISTFTIYRSINPMSAHQFLKPH